jgi:hypothetical protein
MFPLENLRSVHYPVGGAIKLGTTGLSANSSLVETDALSQKFA